MKNKQAENNWIIKIFGKVLDKLFRVGGREPQAEAEKKDCRVIVAGSRSFSDYGVLGKELDKLFAENDEFVGKEIKIISGMARGADTLAIDYADKRKLTKILFPANWKRYPRAAGFLRNEDMLLLATHLVAFWDGDSSGTRHMIEIAKGKGIPVWVFRNKAVPLNVYKARVDRLRFLLVENWCICKWCQLFNPECENFAHWVNELKVCIDNLKSTDIKEGIDKKRLLTQMLVTDYDYDKTNMIERIVRDKFSKENINDNHQKVCACAEFADNINSLIDVISIDAIDPDEYLERTFGDA